MPRQAHGKPLLSSGSSKPKKRKAVRGRGLNALETAEREFPDKIKVRQHRLGEAEDDDDKPQQRRDTDGRSAKRRKIDNTIEVADSDEGGSDPDGNEWHVGVGEDDDDSDIDSDDAFGESDEERFADFTFRGSDQTLHQRPKSKSRVSTRTSLDAQGTDADRSDMDVSLTGEEDDGDSLGEDAIDLATAWDMDDAEQKEEQDMVLRKQRMKQKRQQSSPSLADSDHTEPSDIASDPDSDEEDEPFEEFSEGEDVDGDTTSRLRSFVDAITSGENQVSTVQKVPRKQSLPEKPSQFGLPSAGLSAAHLLQYVRDPTQRQSIKMLQAGEKEDGTLQKGGIPGKLSVPLAKRQQDRLDRVAAYDHTKQTVDRWVDTVKEHRRADHVSFPLTDPTKASASHVKTFQPISNDQPHSELEAKIQEIMQESGLASAPHNAAEFHEQQFENLQEKKIPLEEVEARRRELRMQRELMFREEVRAKRIKKIKSKAYRRVHRKEKDRFAVQERERLAAAGVLNSDEEREQNDRRRAEERMGARHRESKWAKAAKASGQTTWNDDAKLGLSELVKRDEELRRRIDGKTIRDVDGSESETDSDFSNSDDEDSAFNEKLSQLEKEPQMHGKSKLADMAFMRKAEAERKAQNDQELRELRRGLNQNENDAPGSESDVPDEMLRQTFGRKTVKAPKPLKPLTEPAEFEERLTEDEAEDVEQAKLDNVATSLHKNVVKVDGANKSMVKRSNGLSKASPTTLPPNTSTHSPASFHHGKLGFSKSRQESRQSILDDNTSSSGSEDEPVGELDAKDKLALDIFAGDDEEDLRQRFQKEKQQTVEDEGDQVVDNTLPGWGSWTGAGVSRREQKKGKGRQMAITKGIAPEARKDAKLERVIVNEKRVKKNGKYLATELPHPFESKQQYERSLRLPMGPEWSTRNHFQDAIKPRVLLKQGHVIKPMARPSV